VRAAAALILAAMLCATSVAADDQEVSILKMALGQRVSCQSANGCIAMDFKAFQVLLMEATRHGAKACRDST
jgi:hypothetical protein